MTTTWIHKCSCLVLLFALALTGCPPIDTGTAGEAGRVTFFGNHTNLRSILFAAGGATFDVHFDSPEAVASIESSDPTVLQFNQYGATGFRLETGAPGTAAAILRNQGGREIDRLTLRVARVTQLDFGRTDETVRLLPGVQLTVRFVRRDAAGNQLLGQGGLRVSATGTVAVLDTGVANPVEYLFTGTPGVGAIEAEADGLRVSLPVEVVSSEQLVRIEGTAYSSYTAGNQAYAPVVVTGFTSEGPVYGVRCDWQAVDPGIQALDQYVTREVSVAPMSNTTFSIPRPGTYRVRCDVGGQTTIVTITR